MTLIVRSATSSDLATIARFNTALARETEQRALDGAVLQAGIAAVLNDPDKGRYFIAEEFGRPVGQLMVTTEWSDWRNSYFWWLQSVYVIERARRRGVFHALYNHVESLLKTEPGVCGIRLRVERANEGAQQTYATVGMSDSKYVVMEVDRSGAARVDENGADAR